MDPNNGSGGNTPPANSQSNGDGNNATPPNSSTPPADNGQPNGQGAGDPGNSDGGIQLTKEQLEAAFQHPRFKELNERAKLADKLKADQDAAEKKRLEEAGEHQKLAEQYQQEATQAKTALQTERINNALYVEANKLGAQDASVVAKLVDHAQLTIGDDGAVSGADQALAELKKSQPYLFKTGPASRVGGGDTNPQGGGDTEFTASQFHDTEFYSKNQAAMDKALIAGRVDMTR